jgi:DUF1365 family protein
MIKLVLTNLIHRRYRPKAHGFKNSFCWFELDLLNLEQDIKGSHFISYNRWNLYSFYDSDHTQFSKNKNILDQCRFFLAQNNVHEQIVEAKLYTHLRVLGYVFNPVSFYLFTLNNGRQCAIIEIGNTFKEFKPIFVGHDSFDQKDSFSLTTVKHFYVSPFIDLDSHMTFNFSLQGDQLKINISDKKEELILTSDLKAEIKPFSDKNLFKNFIRFPLQTWFVIFFIHWHALLLYLKKVPFHRKNDNPQLQQGVYQWNRY